MLESLSWEVAVVAACRAWPGLLGVLRLVVVLRCPGALVVERSGDALRLVCRTPAGPGAAR